MQHKTEQLLLEDYKSKTKQLICQCSISKWNWGGEDNDVFSMVVFIFLFYQQVVLILTESTKDRIVKDLKNILLLQLLQLLLILK